ncbi:TlpA disulfide reductase family protein [Algoriphagus sp.]|uniref:peroxiredoxin family protein n=1 Tax=Algoriphagus sp. TaxID=1872435 RepID=UPI002634F545|nr:TlpA disulfide reductase family protein [Algoriphagus sp.]
MRKIILSVLILGLLASAVWLVFSVQQKKDATAEAEVRAESIPAIRLTSLSGDTFSLPQLSSGIATVLIYFNSTCEICQMELQSIGKRILEFDDAQILLVSSQERSEISEFYNNHSLKNSSNVFWLMDEDMEVAAHYGVRSVPAIFCYDSEGKLQGKFQGPVKVDLILEKLGISKTKTP